MLKKGRLAFASTLLMLIAAFVAACGNQTGTVNTQQQAYDYTKPTTKGGTIVYSDWQFPDTLSPWFQGAVVDLEVSNGLWGGPIVLGPKGEILPDELLEVPTTANGDVSKDGLTVTMKLRHDLKWSDGQELTTDDFIYAMNVLLDPNTAPASTYGFDKIASYTATDKYTLVLKYKEVFASYIYYLPFPQPKHVYGTIADKDLATTQNVNLTPKVTSGPFVVSDFASDQSITLTPNKYYTSTTLHPTVVDKLVFKHFATKDALIAGYQAGETDHAEDFSNADIQKVQNLPGVSITPQLAYEHVDFNFRKPYLQDLNVRKAITEAIDRCQVVQVTLHLTCDQGIANAIIPPASADYDASVKPFDFNLDQAKKDMQAAGYDCSSGTCKKADGTAFPTLNLVTTSGNQQRADVTQIVKQDLAALGITVNLDGQYYPAGTLFADYGHNGILARGNYDLALYAYVFSSDTAGDFSSFLTDQIPSDSNPTGGNNQGISDPKIDQMLTDINHTIDPTQHKQKLSELQKYILSQAVVIPMYQRPNITLTSTNVGNYFSNGTSQGNEWNIGDWYLKTVSK